ncbi:MAG: transcriptional regulator [Desulfitibacter sp. BRH_c19]|nr:MAG: transcriptional regulator [Desulfitibacter sp. BRH_c19]
MITKEDVSIIRELQKDLPLVSRPYNEVAQKLGITEEELLKKIRFMKKEGYIRRIGAALRHREMGIEANAMIVWKVPEKDCERVGNEIASFPEVTHCYQRPTSKDWHFNIFAMIHFPTREECEQMANKISNLVGDYPYQLFFSTEELKKISMKYFLE